MAVEKGFKKMFNYFMKHLEILFLFLICFFLLLSCKTDKKKTDYYLNLCNSPDSIINFYQSNYSKLPNSFSTQITIRFQRSKQPNEFKKLAFWFDSFHMTLSRNEPLKIHSKVGLAYYAAHNSKLDLLRNNLQIIGASSILKEEHDTLIVLNYYNLKGMLYYFQEKFDSSISMYQIALKYAINYHRDKEIEQFSNNIGAIHYSMGRTESAINNFLIAYRLLKKRNGNNPMLVNNIATILMAEHKLKQAELYFNNCQQELSINDSSYLGVLIKLNYCRLKILKGESESAFRYFNALQKMPIPDVLISDYLINGFLLNATYNKNELYKFIELNKRNIRNHREELLTQYYSGFNKVIQLIPNTANLLGFDSKLLSSPISQTSNTQVRMAIFDLLAQQAKYDNEPIKFQNYVSNYINLLRLESNSLDSIRVLDIESKIAYQKIQSDNKVMLHEREKDKKIIVLQNIVMYSTLILLIVGYSFVAYRHKFIKQSEDLLKSKLQFANFEAEQLKIEKELNTKITAISNYMIDEFKRIADRLSNSQFSRDPHILEIRADMIRLSNAELNSDPLSHSLDQQKRYSSIWELNGFQDLTKTQREILIMSIEDMRPKEIAQLLNISYSHIRNTRTFLKKQMSVMNFYEFSELKKLIDY